MSPTPQDPSLFPIDAVPWHGAVHVLRAAVRRHWLTALALPVVFVTVAAAAVLLPRTYSGELRMMARRGTSVMSAVAVPRRAVAPGFDAPSQGAVEIGLSLTARLAIVKHASLRAHWIEHRPTLTRIKDSLRERLLGPLPTEAIDDAVISMLESRLRLRVQDDVISLRVTWSDAEAVPLILTQAQRAFVIDDTSLARAGANWSNVATVTNTTGTLLFGDTEVAQHESRYVSGKGAATVAGGVRWCRLRA